VDTTLLIAVIIVRKEFAFSMTKKNKNIILVQILMFVIFCLGSIATFACSLESDSTVLKHKLPKQTSQTLQANTDPYIVTINPPAIKKVISCGSGRGSITLYFNPYEQIPSEGNFAIIEHVEGELPGYMEAFSDRVFEITNNSIRVNLVSQKDETNTVFNAKFRVTIVAQGGEFTLPGEKFNLQYSGDHTNNLTRYSEFEPSALLEEKITDAVNEIQTYIRQNRFSASQFSGRDEPTEYDIDVRENAKKYLSEMGVLIESADNIVKKYLKIEGLRLHPRAAYPEYGNYIRVVDEYFNTMFGIALGKSYYIAPSYIRNHRNDSAVFDLELSGKYFDSLQQLKSKLLETYSP